MSSLKSQTLWRKDFLNRLGSHFILRTRPGWLISGVFCKPREVRIQLWCKWNSCYARKCKCLASWPQWAVRRRQGIVRMRTSEATVEPHGLRSITRLAEGEQSMLVICFPCRQLQASRRNPFSFILVENSSMWYQNRDKHSCAGWALPKKSVSTGHHSFHRHRRCAHLLW